MRERMTAEGIERDSKMLRKQALRGDPAEKGKSDGCLVPCIMSRLERISQQLDMLGSNLEACEHKLGIEERGH